MTGLLDNVTDLDAYLMDLINKTRTEQKMFGEGPIAGAFREERQGSAAPSLVDPIDAPSSRSANAGVRFGEHEGLHGRIGGSLYSEPGGPTQSGLNAGIGLGPLSLNGGLNFAPDGTATPSYGIGREAELFGGQGYAGVTLTPGQQKALALQWRKRLENGGDIGFAGGASFPDRAGPAGFYAGIGGRIPF